MIAVNNVKIEELPKDHAFLKAYDACMKWIKTKKTFIFDYPPEKIIAADPSVPGSRPQHPQDESVPSKLLYTNEDGSWEVTYYESSIRKEKEWEFLPRYMDVGRMQVNIPDFADKAFWLLFVSKWVDKDAVDNSSVAKFMNHNRSPRTYVLENLQKDAVRMVESEILVTKVREYLLGSKEAEEEKLRNIAATFNIPNTANLSKEMIQAALIKLLLVKNNKGEYNNEMLKDFIGMVEKKDMGFSKVLELSSLAQKALEQKLILKFNPDPDRNIQRQSVYLIDENNEPLEHICDIRPGIKHIQAIAEGLREHPELVDYIKERLK